VKGFPVTSNERSPVMLRSSCRGSDAIWLLETSCNRITCTRPSALHACPSPDSRLSSLCFQMKFFLSESFFALYHRYLYHHCNYTRICTRTRTHAHTHTRTHTHARTQGQGKCTSDLSAGKLITHAGTSVRRLFARWRCTSDVQSTSDGGSDCSRFSERLSTHNRRS
jgi:hypothetical protein